MGVVHVKTPAVKPVLEGRDGQVVRNLRYEYGELVVRLTDSDLMSAWDEFMMSQDVTFMEWLAVRGAFHA